MPRIVTRVLPISMLCALVIGLAAPPARADPDGPPAPRTDEFDWLQFRNGEWLKGEITDLQDDDLVFDSDELDEQKIDLDDVYALYTHGIATITFRDRSTIEGRVAIEGDRVIVANDEGEQEFDRSKVRSMFLGEFTEWNLWSGKISFGATFRQGNTDTTDISGFFRLARRAPLNRLWMEYTGRYGEVDGDRTVDNHRAVLNFDLYATERLFVRIPGLEFFRDEFQNINYRITPSVGLGYDVIDESDLTWSVLGGVGYQYTRFVDVEAGADEDRGDTVAVLGTRLTWEPTSTIDLAFRYDLSVPVPSTRRWVHRASFEAEFELYKDLDLDVQIIWDRVNDPEPSNGVTPEPDDIQLYVGLGWNF